MMERLANCEDRKQTGMLVNFWSGRREGDTGGAGFLGGSAVEKLMAHDCQASFTRRKAEYNLQRLCAEARPSLILRLPAVVGGEGADRERRPLSQNAAATA